MLKGIIILIITFSFFYFIVLTIEPSSYIVIINPLELYGLISCPIELMYFTGFLSIMFLCMTIGPNISNSPSISN